MRLIQSSWSPISAMSNQAHQPSVVVIGPSLRILGGQAVMAKQLVDHLASAGWDVEFLPINPRPPGLMAHLESVKYVRTASVSSLYVASLLSKLRRFDVIHLFSASYLSFLIAQMPAIASASVFSKPVILNYRSGEADDHLQRSGRIVKGLLNKCHSIVVPSGYLVEVFRKFGYQATAIPNFVDPEFFGGEARREIQPKILVPRSLEPLYNVACALRTFQLVKREIPAAELTILGEGSEKSDLLRMVTDLDLRDVRFAGRVERSEIVSVYRSHDLLLNTSSIDNMPISILEGLAAGMPVVTTAAGGIPYIIDDRKNGLLFPLDDHAQAAGLIIELYRDSSEVERLSNGARDDAAQYRWERVSDAWFSLYSRVYEEFHEGEGRSAITRDET